MPLPFSVAATDTTTTTAGIETPGQIFKNAACFVA